MPTFDDFHARLRTRLRQLREERGLLQADVEDAHGIAQSTLQQIEQGTRVPKLDTLYRIAGAYGMTMSELVDVRGVRPAASEVRRGGYRPKGKPVTGTKPSPKTRSKPSRRR